MKIAKNFIIGKLFNERWVLERTLRDHALRINSAKFKQISELLAKTIKRLKEENNLDSIRGIEGESASLYFSLFNEMILSQKDTFQFSGRNRRHPTDNVNAVLSFVYVLLSNECTAA